MSKFISFSVLFIGLFFTSCIEIIDDLLILSDGSGTFKYTVNLSSSKVKINSILALDSLNGEKVPSKEEIQNKVKMFKSVLRKSYGIKNIEITEDYTEYIVKLSCDFSDIYCLQLALVNCFDSISLNPQPEVKDFQWVDWTNTSLKRSIPNFLSLKKFKYDDKENELLKSGYYTTISRFDKEILDFSNENGKLSKSKKAYMHKIDIFSLKDNNQLLESTINLKDN